MAANTTPDNITYPVSTDGVATLETVFATLANSVQTAFNGRNKNMYIRYATYSAMTAVPGTDVGQHATVYADSTTALNGDYVWNGTAWANLGANGYALLKPATANNGTVGANGTVTFTGVASVSLNGVFTNTYDNYDIIFDLTKGSASTLGMLVRVSGTDSTSANYNTIRTSALGGARWLMDYSAAAERVYGKVTLFKPGIAIETGGVGLTTQRPSLVSSSFGLDHSLATAYDGFTLLPNTGNITGTVRVYGYNQ